MRSGSAIDRAGDGVTGGGMRGEGGAATVTAVMAIRRYAASNTTVPRR